MIAHTYQEEALRWCCRASLLPLPGMENRGHTTGRDTTAPHGDQGANDIADHVLQEAIGAQEEDQVRRSPPYPEAEEMSHWRTRVARGSAKRRKIVLPYKDSGGYAHRWEIKRLGDMPGVGRIKGRRQRVIADEIDVCFASGRIAGVKRRRNLFGVLDDNVCR
jgi:hypothetical protein